MGLIGQLITSVNHHFTEDKLDLVYFAFLETVPLPYWQLALFHLFSLTKGIVTGYYLQERLRVATETISMSHTTTSSSQKKEHK